MKSILILIVDGPVLGGKKQVVSNSFSSKGSARSMSLGLYNQNAISNAVGVKASSGSLAKHGNAHANAVGLKSAKASAVSHSNGHSFSRSASLKGNSLAKSANYGEGNSIAAAIGR